MNYFLFLNHPKGEEVYKLDKERETSVRKYFEMIDTLDMEIDILGKKYQAKIDYEMFSKLSLFDCFNCNINCCADSPSKLSKNAKDFLIDNFDEFEEITSNVEISGELGYEEDEVINFLKNEEIEENREIVREIEETEEMCFYAFKKDNKTTLCSIHSMCLNSEKNINIKELYKRKPLVCSLWPIEILSENDDSMLYITLPDDFTNSFTIENYYEIPCLNEEFTISRSFRRKNPCGFDSEYRPIIETYEETIKNCLGEKTYQKIKEKLNY